MRLLNNIFCTLILVLGQDEVKGQIEVADGQKSNPLCLDKGQTQTLVKPLLELFVIHEYEDCKFISG